MFLYIETFGNGCVACSNDEVSFFKLGACEEEKPENHICKKY